MKLVTPDFEALFDDYPIGSQKKETDPLVIAKLYDPIGSGVWYLLEYDKKARIVFCYVTGLFDDEFGYISLDEMEALGRPESLTIKQDFGFKQERLSQFLKKMRNE